MYPSPPAIYTLSLHDALPIRVEPADNRVRFAVADEGLGIPRGEESRIFEKFYRLDPHMARGIGGTGLGLYIADRKSTRLNSSHVAISYAVFCLKKKKNMIMLK